MSCISATVCTKCYGDYKTDNDNACIADDSVKCATSGHCMVYSTSTSSSACGSCTYDNCLKVESSGCTICKPGYYINNNYCFKCDNDTYDKYGCVGSCTKDVISCMKELAKNATAIVLNVLIKFAQNVLRAFI